MKSLSLLWKILIPLLIFAALVDISLQFLLSEIADENKVSTTIENSRSIINSAEEVLKITSEHQKKGLYNNPLKDSTITKEDFLSTIPVISSMRMAEATVTNGGGKLKTPSISYRNEDNAPDSYEREILENLAANNVDEFYEVHEESGTIRYFKAIRLDESCMKCHGDPNNPEDNIWGSEDGTDFFGYNMENMSVGDIKGAYEVIYPLNAVLGSVDDTSIFDIFIKFVTPVLILLLIGFIIYYVVNKEIKNTATLIENANQDFQNGNLDSRIDPNKIVVDMRPIAESSNNMVETLIGPINLMTDYTQQLSKGNLPPLYNEDVKGDFNRFKDSLNSLIHTLNLFTNEVSNVHRKHNEEGDIDVEMDSSKFSGVYREMSIGVNELVDSHIQTKKNTIKIVSAYGNGDFTATMPELIGKKKFINDALNLVQDNLYGISEEINSLIESAKKGELDKRGDQDKFSGGWKTLIEGLNELMGEIDKPISESQIVLTKLSEGDLTATMDGDYSGGFDDLKQKINSLGSSLQQLIGQVKDSVDLTTKTSKQLSENAESIAAGTQEQSSQSEDVASAVEQMSRTITENAMAAQKTAENANKNKNVANEGGKIVSQTLQKMHDIADVVSTSAQNIERLGNSSNKINEIVSVIKDIAEQTNLLALNAAIEAARAGEQGRGFAVVADEVRKLAERTTTATKEISDMITGIQDETLSAVNAMNTGTAEVDMGIKLADKAGIALNEIVESSEGVLHMINSIAAANEQQSSTAEEISKNVLSISDVSRDTARRVEEVAMSSESLRKLTDTLNIVMSKFKISEYSSDINVNDKSPKQLATKNVGSTSLRGLRVGKETNHN